jgi:hypothetical protein
MIVVENEDEFDAFREFLQEYDDEDLDLDRLFRERMPTYEDVCDMTRMNYEDPSILLFEVHQDEPCSLTWSGADNYDNNVDWYGVEPYRMSDLI